MTPLGRFLLAGRRLGSVGTSVTRQAVYGTRRIDGGRSGSDALSQRSAVGVGPRSVWKGPAQARAPYGAPILRRL